MIQMKDIQIFEKSEVKILEDALWCYLNWLGTVKATCKEPVIKGQPIDERIAIVRSLRRVCRQKSAETE